MRTILIFLIFSISYPSLADTIPRLRVYYNDKKIKDLNLRRDNTVKIFYKDYKPKDVLSFQYFDDMKCHNCEYEISVVADGKIEMSTQKIRNKNELVKIDLDLLFNHVKQLKNKKALFLIYLYTTDAKKNRDNGPRIMSLYIE
jgi:hypothetical protein